MLFKIGFSRVSANTAPNGILTFSVTGREVEAWVANITGNPAPTLTLTGFDAATVDVRGEVSGEGTVDVPWIYRAPGLASVAIDVDAQLANGESPNWTGSDSTTIPASFWNSGITYSAAVTATDSEDDVGSLLKLVTSPAHLAAYDAGQEVVGLFEVTRQSIVGGPQILYPGLVEIDAPDPGGVISLTHAPWAVGDGGTITIGYRVLLGSTVLATSLPYDTTSDSPGDLIEVFADVSDSNGSRSFRVGSFTLAENPLGPVLSNFQIDYDTNEVAFVSDLPATVTWRRYPPGYVFENQASEVLAGTGAIDGGSYDIEAGANSDAITFTGGLSGEQELWIVARVGSGPISNVIGGPINIAPSTGTPLTSPNFRASSIGGDGSSLGVTSVAITAPVYESGDLVILPIGIDCAASLVAGVTATGPNGETATVKQALTDNGVAGDSGQSIALLYYRATAANTSGSITINVTEGGTKSAEQIICTPIARFNVKASGDPFAQVVKTSSSTAAATVETAALTAVNAASRIEAAIVSEFDLPAGTAPTGWTVREVGRLGAQSIQTLSRNAAVEAASESIAAVSLPLSVNRAWVGLTWELLPLGA